MNEMIHVYINGTQDVIARDISIAKLLDSKNLEVARVVVEVNQVIVKRTCFDTFHLKDGDRIEILRFVGGG